MLVQTCRSLPATCCTASKRQSCNQSVRLELSAWPAGQPSKPGFTACHPFQLFNSRILQKQRVRVANPRHDSDQEASRQFTNSWDEPPPTDVGQDGSQQASGVDWVRMQSLAALTGASTLAAVVVLQLSGKTDIPKFAYNNVPESVQDVLPEQLGAKQHKAPWQLFDISAFLQTAKDEAQKEGLALQEGVQKQGLALQPDTTKPDKLPSKDKVKSERQANFEKTKQVKTAKNEQNKKDKQQRQKQKDKEKEVAERKLKEQKEKERKEAEKRKKFRDQALVGGSIFGMSALTFGKWQLFASLGAVIFRTIGGPTLLSSVLRTPGYIIGRGVRVVEWNVAEHPDKPDGDLASMKLRALTPDGIRMAIAKEYGLSNYREVRQVSHWVTTATPHFFEPMRTAATFKMLPDPAFVVTAIMLKTISGVAASSRRLAETGHLKLHRADTQEHCSNGASHRQLGDASTGGSDTAQDERVSPHAVHAGGHHRDSSSSSSSSSSPQSARHQSGRHASTSPHVTPSHQQFHSSNGDGSSLQSSARGASQSADLATCEPDPAEVGGPTNRASERQQSDGTAISPDRSYGNGVHRSAQAGSWDQPQHSGGSGDDQAATPSRGSSKGNGRAPLAAVAAFSSNSGNGSGCNNSSQEQSQNEGQPSQYQSNEDEVAGALHDETDANGPPARTKDPHYWHEPSVLQAVCGSPSVSACAWGERLQLSTDFVPVSEFEEEALVLAIGASGDYMLSLFRAYAPHNALTFMHYARRHCQQT